MRPTVILATCLFWVTPAHALDWTPSERTDDGIMISAREFADRDVPAIRGEIDLNAPATEVAAMILDPARGPDWIDSLKETRQIRVLGPDEFVQYDHMRMPPLVKDRDFVNRVTVTRDAVNGTITILYRSVVDAEAPETSYVRGETLYASYVLRTVAGTGEQKTAITAEFRVDPKGDLPRWVVNKFQKNWPVKTLRNLRREVLRRIFNQNPEPGVAPFALNSIIAPPTK